MNRMNFAEEMRGLALQKHISDKKISDKVAKETFERCKSIIKHTALNGGMSILINIEHDYYEENVSKESVFRSLGAVLMENGFNATKVGNLTYEVSWDV